MGLGDRSVVVGRYFNANYQAMAIVATISEGIDWSAYANGVDYTLREQDAAEWVAANGSKLSADDARYFFPQIELPYRS